jgi:D-3-phosphoglycerate dehydrogenase
MRTRIVIPDDFPPVYKGHPELERLKELGDVAVYDTKAIDTEELAGRLENAEVVVNVRAFSRFDRHLLARLPELKLISILGTGTDNVDLDAATDLGVVVANAPGASTTSVAELNFALILAVARAVALSDRKVREGVWHHQHGMELYGKTVGIVGLGLIGSEVARFAQAFGMNAVAWSFSHDPVRADRLGIRLVDLDDLFRISDVVSLHVRNSPEAAGLVGPRQIGLMKRGSILINTARAAVVDEKNKRKKKRKAVKENKI